MSQIQQVGATGQEWRQGERRQVCKGRVGSKTKEEERDRPETGRVACWGRGSLRDCCRMVELQGIGGRGLGKRTVRDWWRGLSSIGP